MGFTSTEDNWKETVKVENVYNRLFAFNGRSWHGVKTFGSDERLTLVFFFKYLTISLATRINLLGPLTFRRLPTIKSM